MTNAIQAAETIERLAAQYEDMMFAAKVFKEIGIIDQHLNEITRQRNVLLEKVDQVRLRTDNAVREFDDLKQAHELSKAEWAAETIAHKTSAQQAYQQIVDEAKAKAAVIEAASSAQTALKVAETDTLIRDAFTRLDDATNELRAVEAAVANATTRLEQAESEKAGVDAYIDGLRAPKPSRHSSGKV